MAIEDLNTVFRIFFLIVREKGGYFSHSNRIAQANEIEESMKLRKFGGRRMQQSADMQSWKILPS